MARELTTTKENLPGDYLSLQEQFLHIRVGEQLFGIPVIRVRDVLKPQKLTKIPLARPEILGFINLRGRIVTVIDMRKRLLMGELPEGRKKMFVVVEADSELYCLQVDEVGDTKTMLVSDFENSPENMEKLWKDVSSGVFKLDKELMLVLDINHLTSF